MVCSRRSSPLLLLTVNLKHAKPRVPPQIIVA